MRGHNLPGITAGSAFHLQSPVKGAAVGPQWLADGYTLQVMRIYYPPQQLEHILPHHTQ